MQKENNYKKTKENILKAFMDYPGRLVKRNDIITENDNEEVYISFGCFKEFMEMWYERYTEYLNAVERANKSIDPIEKSDRFVSAQKSFKKWMEQEAEK